MFDVIYKIAKESNDFEVLKKRLKKRLKKTYIDALKIGNGLSLTAACQLAMEGVHDKVEWMRQLGANVSAIAYGYALGGYEEHVEEYRTQHKVYEGMIAYGYALAKNDKQVEAYRTKYFGIIDSIAQGYAQIGNHKLVEKYRTQYGAFDGSIVFGYAFVGNHDYVEQYYKVYNTHVDEIVVGYVHAGNDEYVELYRGRGACVNNIAQLYALVGNDKQVEVYRRQHGAEVSGIVEGYKSAKNHGMLRKYDINCLLDSYLEERKEKTDSSGVIKEYFYGSFFATYQKSFTQKSKAVNALIEALDGMPVDFKEHLDTLRNGTLGQELRAFIKSGMGDTLVGQKVRTVSEFVHALQHQNPYENNVLIN